MAESYFIAKVFRQHSSLVMVVPGAVCIALNVKKGQYMVLTWSQQDGSFKLTKFKPEGAKDERIETDTDRADQGG